MKVKLLNYTNLGTKEYKAHLNYNFSINGISRALLQELARHRCQNLSVQSTRYVLRKKLKDEKPFISFK